MAGPKSFPTKTLLASAAVAVALVANASAHAESINAGDRVATSSQPFRTQTAAEFDTPWAIAFLPDGRMLITEKQGHIFLVTQSGQKTPVANVPDVLASGQNGLLDIAVAPDFATSSHIYFTYVEPGAGGRLVLSRATLSEASSATLVDRTAIWRQTPAGGGGQPGGIIAFDPAGNHLFLTVGDRMQPTSAQDPDQARGKLLRLNLDGSTPTDNPHATEGGVRALTWTIGHRNPYGLAFAPDGRLWLDEMGPRGGDEFNLIEPDLNYGWPVVSNGDNYSGTSIPRHATRPEFAAPAVYWTPVIAPAGLAFYEGALFPQWRGSALIGGLRVQSLVRVGFLPGGQPDEVERWDMGARIRDVAVAADGAVWVIEDSSHGGLVRLTPAR
ncbi:MULTISPECIES: PQQ-dependent sugar dehydrogenase [unclassified Mesorhizobium]|uniref:PQQ-dependent sugar dehydrogenase n=1 Tax=unclassified Mesorhizobium TaxID=325217 RepID=UPI000FD96D52|nr:MULTISPECIES: PQQ-dependent sugar dehydrogenase [unclassified Mesorhizobium]TGR23190.1 PQQ-dependent sugar dehydrogenase [Mesorhizobium sp. M8A.F.Ca.ET.197.01.1.1]TGR39081.1 PQQ-dependent sugar dehydrogenase [bacterium M00.F.Ca.ET.199.01.1.1]TGR46675.1 PQQ-dependent sugar dehydrogenase [Mesorhizobium sp. M8A.F.Ca.ET.198.01.1.1]TGV85331.1 PQQ-dependent sugar dehydrogenase [Mesorhizobium sp. M00.F.Ca.ET.149.01.1.1]